MFDTSGSTLQPILAGDNTDLREAILSAVEEIVSLIRPAIQRDGGDIKLISIEGDIIRVRLSGACLHCAQAGQTLGGIRREIVRKLGKPYRVLPSQDD